MIVDLKPWPGHRFVLEVLLAIAADPLPGHQMDLPACLGGACVTIGVAHAPV